MEVLHNHQSQTEPVRRTHHEDNSTGNLHDDRSPIPQDDLGLTIPYEWMDGARPGFWIALPFIAFLLGWISYSNGKTWLTIIALIFLFGSGYVLLSLFNTTTFTCAADRLTIKHAPFPWPGGVSIPVTSIVSFTCEESRGEGGVSFTVFCKLSSGKELDIVPTLSTGDPERMIGIVRQIVEFYKDQRPIGFVDKRTTPST